MKHTNNSHFHRSFCRVWYHFIEFECHIQLSFSLSHCLITSLESWMHRSEIMDWLWCRVICVAQAAGRVAVS